MYDDELRDETPEQGPVSWFDEESERAWNALLRKHRTTVLLGLPAIVVSLAMPIAIGILVRVVSPSLSFLRSVKKSGEGSTGRSNAATAIVTEDRVEIRKPHGECVELDPRTIKGYTFDLRTVPVITFFLADGTKTEFPVSLPEVYSKGVWLTLNKIDGFMPKTARREVLTGTEPSSSERTRKDARTLVLSGLGAVALSCVGIFWSLQMGLGSSGEDAVVGASLIFLFIGLGLLVYGAVCYVGYRKIQRARGRPAIPGALIATFEPDQRKVMMMRLLACLALFFGAMSAMSAAMEPKEAWFGFVVGVVAVIAALYLFHVASLESRAIIVTDQYVAILRGDWCALVRHGQYKIYRGSFWMGRYLKIPDHAFILATDEGSVDFANRAGKDGFALNRIAEFSREAKELSAALGLD